MKIYRTIVSNEAPPVRDALWVKPVDGGFVMYMCVSGSWSPLKLVDDNSTADTTDAIVQEAVDKAIADVTGKSTDDKNKLTLNGLKAYIDDALANLE